MPVLHSSLCVPFVVLLHKVSPDNCVLQVIVLIRGEWRDDLNVKMALVWAVVL